MMTGNVHQFTVPKGAGQAAVVGHGGSGSEGGSGAGGGGGGGGGNAMDARVKSLEEDMKKLLQDTAEIKGLLRAAPTGQAFGELVGRIGSLPSAKDFGDLSGRVNALPTTSKIAAIVGTVGAIVTILLRWKELAAFLGFQP